jgi:hypothetical protein
MPLSARRTFERLKECQIIALQEGEVGLAQVLSSALHHLEAGKRDVTELTQALRKLHDHQNGCPLPKYEQGWNAAMEEAQRLLERHESTTPTNEPQG